MTIWPGRAFPLGATYDGRGTNFSVFSEAAESVELCLFDAAGHETRVCLPEVDAYCWHGYVPGIGPGQRYGFRVHGPYAPEEGHRCNPAKLLLDPYAKAVDGQVQWNEALFGHRFADPENTRNDDDSGPFMPKGVVLDSRFDWEGDTKPGTPLHKSIIYEVHVKGFTARHPEIPKELRGTYAGLAHPASLKYLTGLGITAVELLPVHQFVHDSGLVERGLRNYWGYNSISFLAPHNEYSSSGQDGQQVNEFKNMVRTLHRAGIEVILDVVYNHTAEGNHLGPTLSFKGLDNAAYYRLIGDQRRYYMDYTGTGNTLNMRQPHVLQLLMDSLRYWVLEMHVDGFRFDLAATLARELHEVDRLSAFFDLIQQDPVVSRVKLIAEPWDVGEGGYQVGNFPPLWSEWNGRYRDTVRDYWKGGDQTLNDFAYRFTGSSDLYRNVRPAPFGEREFRHRARRIHPARSRFLQREAQRGERRRQPRRREPQPLVEHGRGRRYRGSRDSRGARPPAAQLPRDAAVVARHPDDSRRRRDRPHAAGQQQRLLPGQRDLLVRLDPRSTQASTRSRSA